MNDQKGGQFENIHTENDVIIEMRYYACVMLLISAICDFSDDICDWSQETLLDEFDWLIGSGADTRYGPSGTGSLPDKTSGVIGGLL